MHRGHEELQGGVVSVHPLQVVVIGGGQAGLAVGYHLKRLGLSFVILDGEQRVGDSWRKRWDSLRLFSPARFDSLPGLPFPAPPDSYPTKDQMGDYLEAYAAHFKLPILNGSKVSRLSRHGSGYLVLAGARHFVADHVVIATGAYQRPKIPEFAPELAPGIVQFHASDYRNPQQLGRGPVLIAGAGNSGAEIALELVQRQRVLLSGAGTGEVRFRLEKHPFLQRMLLRGVFHHLLTVNTPFGRKARKGRRKAVPLIRAQMADLVKAGVQRVARVTGVRDGLPLLEDGSVADVASVIWCTGYKPGFGFVDLPVFDADGEPMHESGIVKSSPGLYFVGLHFLHAMSSAMIHGVGRDAARIASAIAAQQPEESHAPLVH